MKKRQITITIDGLAGHGKTTLAQHLGNYLLVRHGVKVVLCDEGAERALDPEFISLPEYFDADVTIRVGQK